MRNFYIVFFCIFFLQSYTAVAQTYPDVSAFTNTEFLVAANGTTAQQDAYFRDLLHQNAKQGDTDTLFALGLMYELGLRGFPQDDSKAMEYYRKAAEHGNAEAQYNLGLMYKEGRGRIFGRRDERKAVEWFQKAANQGNADAQVALGVMYEEGRGIAKDERKAFEWYKKAADQRNYDAQFNLARMYAKEAEQGDATAQYNLGVMYFYGRGVPQDNSKAKEWILKAALQGLKPAQEALKLLP